MCDCLPFHDHRQPLTDDLGAVGAAAHRSQGTGVGVATGWRSQLVVIDLDVKHGEPGPQNVAAFLTDNRLEFPAAPSVHTPSGGWHIWLRWPAEYGTVGNRKAILPGVDIRG